MDNLTFGEQVKIMLGRKGMTIKELAEIIEERTGKKMSRQNMTQRLGRDNFQEQDMRMIANILDCSFQLSILSVEQPTLRLGAEEEVATEQELRRVKMRRLQKAVEREDAKRELKKQKLLAEQQEETAETSEERDMTIGELYEIHEELSELEKKDPEEETASGKEETKERFHTGGIFLRKKESTEPEEKQPERAEQTEQTGQTTSQQQVPQQTVSAETGSKKTEEEFLDDEEELLDGDFEPVLKNNDVEEDLEKGEVNPYTGREYQSNSVRMHPTRIGYVQVYDRGIHKWTDMTEWAFLGYQERKKALMGKEYEPPIYLD